MLDLMVRLNDFIILQQSQVTSLIVIINLGVIQNFIILYRQNVGNEIKFLLVISLN